MRTLLVLGALGALSLGACDGDDATAAFPEFRGDAEVTRAAVRDWAARGAEAIPALRAGLEGDSVKVQQGCRRALALITGQWGGDGRLLWQRSVEGATGGDRPLMVLHLFGSFDEEFC